MKLRCCIIIVLCAVTFSAGRVLAHEGENEAFVENGGELHHIQVEPSGQAAVGLQTVFAEKQKIENAFSATGEVQAAETESFQVTPAVSGVVQKVFVKQGDAVKAGQPLIVINSVEVANAITDLLNTKAQVAADIARTKINYQSQIVLQKKEAELTKQNFDRQDALLKEKISAEKDFQNALNAHDQSKLKLETLQQKEAREIALLEQQLQTRVRSGRGQLHIMGLTDDVISKALNLGIVTADFPIKSPVTGIVTVRTATVGERIEPGKQIFSIANFSPIWILVDVFQEQISDLKLHQQVKLVTPSNVTLTGQIDNIGSIVDPIKKTLRVRIVSANREGLLRPGMFVSARIRLEGSSTSALAVPASAILTHQERSLIFTRKGDGFYPTYVHLGKRFGDKVEILDGLPPGAQVVVRGAAQLKAQALLHGEPESSSEEKEGHTAGGDEHDESHEQPENAQLHFKLIAVYLAGVVSVLLIGLVWFLVRMQVNRCDTATKSAVTKNVE